jgi:SAM-dependent methyltransferase
MTHEPQIPPPAATAAASPSMPEVRDGLVTTLNQTGLAIEHVDDPYTSAFVEFAVQAPGPALEIGTAFGAAALQVLQRGVPITANDLDPRHLEILRERTPPALRPMLRLAPGRFPDELPLAPGSLGAVLISRVMHFMTPREIEVAVAKLWAALVPGGKVFAVIDTIYLRSIQAFMPVYLERKARGEQSPGWCENFRDYVIPEYRALAPETAHFLDEDTFPPFFARAGFRIERSSFIPRPYYPALIRLDGREGFGLIAVKP